MILLLLAGVISANLALVNVLPLPVLDGGKIVIMVLKRVFGAEDRQFEGLRLCRQLRLTPGLHGLDHFLRHTSGQQPITDGWSDFRVPPNRSPLK